MVTETSMETQKINEDFQKKLCEKFTLSFVKSANEAAKTFPEMSNKDHLIGFAAFTLGAGAGRAIEIGVLGAFKGTFAKLLGKLVKVATAAASSEQKKAEYEDTNIKIKEVIQKADASGKIEFNELFKMFFTRLAVNVFFHFKQVITEWCKGQEPQRIEETMFEEFGKFAGKACYKSCKGSAEETDQTIIKKFTSSKWYENLEEKSKSWLNLKGKVEEAAREIFTTSIPAYWTNSVSSEDHVVVKKSHYKKQNEKSKLRPPFKFEGEDLIKLALKGETEEVTRPPYYIRICPKEHKKMEIDLLRVVKYDKTIDPLEHLKQHVNSAVEQINEHTSNQQEQTLQSLLAEINKSTSSSKPSPLFLVRAPCPHFTGRLNKLKDIHDALNPETSRDQLSLVIITGTGGMGKTQTARKYADIHFKSKFYAVIICINAETLDGLKRSFIEAAVATTHCKYDPKDYSTEDEVEYLVNTVYIQLSKNFKEQNVLIIFDNALKMSSSGSGQGINKFLPNQKYDVLFHVLVTTQNQEWKKPHTLITLDKLDDTDAIAFVKDSFKQNLADQDIEDKLETEYRNLQISLDGYPLGISVATADILDGLGQDTITQDDLTTKIQEYVTKFETSNKQLFFESDSDDSGYGKTMTKVLNLAISRIQNKQAAGNVWEKAIQLFHMMSYLSPDGIHEVDCYALFYSQDWTLFSENNDEVERQRKELNECFRILKNLSLITLEERKHKYRGGSIQLHRLVQKLTREIFKKNVDDLNCWFKPLPFVLSSPRDHASHVLQNICSTFRNNIPLVALASVYSVVVSNVFKSPPIEIHERMKKLLPETERLDTLQQDLQKFLYHILCLEGDHQTSNVDVENVNAGHVTQVLEVMKTYADDVWVQCIGIQAFERLRIDERLFTQDEVKCVLDWINLFFDTRYPQYTNWMKQMHDEALACSLELIALSHGDEGNLRSAEAYIKLTNDTKLSMDDKIECWDSFRIKLLDLSWAFRRRLLQGDDVTRIRKVFQAAVDIFARRLGRSDQDNHFYDFWETCSEILRISKSAKLAKMFWSSKPFMGVFLQCCFSSVKELEKIDELSDYTTLVTAAWTLMALFAEASDEDFNLHGSMHDQMETVLPSVLDSLRILYHKGKDEFIKKFRWLPQYIPLHLVKCFLRNHREKDVWFVKVSLAVLAPAQFFSEDPAVRSQALQFVLKLSKENFYSEDDSEDEDDDKRDDEEDSKSNKVSDEEEN